MSNESGKIVEDPFVEASKAVGELYSISDTYFPRNSIEKIVQLQLKSFLALQLLEKIPTEGRNLPMQAATYEYLTGKVLDVNSVYNGEAEKRLREALNLNPSLVDAWLSLGSCITKKGDLASAKKCFLLSLREGPNKRVLRQLSMLERKMAEGGEDQIIEESIKHAKEAIALDVKDGNSWHNLGSAFITFFMLTGDHGKLRESLKAYQNAEKDERMMSNAELHLDSAIVNQYLENYERALIGFEAAALRDPGLKTVEKVQKIVHLLDEIDSFLRTKVKRIPSLASSLATVNLNSSYRRENIDCLSQGLNKEVAVVAKVLFFIKHENHWPFYYLLCDSNQICFVMSIYKNHSEAINEGDIVTLFDPSYHHVDFSWKGKRYQFRSVRVEFKKQLLVHGKTVSSKCCSQNYFRNMT